MKKPDLLKSFNYAIGGFIYVIKTQRNMRIHFLAAVFIVLSGIYFDFKGIEMLILCGAITFVLLSEMFNTSIEMLVDLTQEYYNPLARIAKDVAAGAVFIASLNAVIAGYLLFAKHLRFSVETRLMRITQSSWHMTFICLIVVLAAVLMIKVFFHKGTPLRGGMPSGHAAGAFAMWAIISLLSYNGLVMILAFVMALLIARSRFVEGVHTVWEVAAGALMGSLTTLIIFQLLR